MVAVRLALMSPVLKLNSTLLAPAGTTTEGGRNKGARLARLMDTLNPPYGAGADKVTVHRAGAYVVKVVGVQVSAVTDIGPGATGGTSVNEVF